MSNSKTAPPSAAAEALTDLILLIFRLNGRLLSSGDQLVAPLGLTSARWQVLGGVAAAEPPRSVAELARDIGVTRQAVQRIVNDLEHEGVLTFTTNPRHRRAQLVELTRRGQELFASALALQRPWSERLAALVATDQVATSSQTMNALLVGLEDERRAG